jgi:ATP-binding cassette subfamily F protein 3
MSNPSSNPVILRFDDVHFAFNDGKKILLHEASCSIRENTKITIMGQNWAGKSTMFKLIMGELKPIEWSIHRERNAKIAIAKQFIPREQYSLTVREYFETAFDEKDYQLDKKIEEVMKEVGLTIPTDRTLGECSGWQQARLLLAHALIQNPDILLLDEPTNNLDSEGIGNLLGFLFAYEKTVIVISHDAEFLNMFTDGVLYLNVQSKQIEQYRWDYNDVLDQIARQIEKEQMQNARMEKEIREKKEKVNFFANKGWNMRKLAAKLKDDIEDAEDNKVELRRDDRTIKEFDFEFENLVWDYLTINRISLMHPTTHQIGQYKLSLNVRKGDRHIIKWPNGIGKTTLLKSLIHAHSSDAMIHDGVRVGYYSQDFSELDMEMTARDSIQSVADAITDQETFRIGAHFLLTWDLLKSPIYLLSEWQKWLLCYARFVAQKPHLLIMDEPTNHINFRHLPILAQALNSFKGWIVLVCHDQQFVDQLTGFDEVDVGRLVG